MATRTDKKSVSPTEQETVAPSELALELALTWQDLRKKVEKQLARETQRLDHLWPEYSWANVNPDQIHLEWGYAAATGHPLPTLTEALCQLAAAGDVSAIEQADIPAAAEALCDELLHIGLVRGNYLEVLGWAYALPYLTDHLEESLWWKVLSRLVSVQQAAHSQAPQESIAQLVLGGELGLVLAWRLPFVPACKSLVEPAKESILGWFDCDEQSLDAALEDAGIATRLVLASGLRVIGLMEKVARRKLKKEPLNTLWELATWVAALTHPDGTAAFSFASKDSIACDVQAGGLLETAAKKLDESALLPAVQASLGQTKSRGRLAWQVSLPEPTLNSEEARLAAMLPEWDVRRGRLHVSYRDEAFRLQVHAGHPMLIDGEWEVEIKRDGAPVTAQGPWVEICHYTDDDVHYLELEQAWSGGVTLQRQLMVVRDDRCLYLADAVLTSEGSSQDKPAQLEYTSRWKIASEIQMEPEEDTWEILMKDSKLRAIAMPLGLPEWRVGPQNGTFDVNADGNLELQMRGIQNLYAAIWFDFERKRFTKPRTWRQLTVAESLRIVAPHEAQAMRVQVGNDQWMLYRSLRGRISRTALGKNLVADFYCGRFNPEDGYIEEMVTVDNDPDDSL
ncbi:hypothetical protein FF011L_07430 [Roseimaritima multifibrata]|uniref:Heparinase II/III-like protein n=1 Tax=Roseimaritima multifibrata TaxID=1930274 RepID=A0A517MB42_9BACT|nr:hypothetical protein [Roseimaritima multifibrata]QDS92007.1 hypothetical protein FF011L_07430 [Roseimaritima multifibrata]